MVMYHADALAVGTAGLVIGTGIICAIATSRQKGIVKNNCSIYFKVTAIISSSLEVLGIKNEASLNSLCQIKGQAAFGNVVSVHDPIILVLWQVETCRACVVQSTSSAHLCTWVTGEVVEHRLAAEAVTWLNLSTAVLNRTKDRKRSIVAYTRGNTKKGCWAMRKCSEKKVRRFCLPGACRP